MHMRPLLEWALSWWMSSWSLPWRVQICGMGSWGVDFSRYKLARMLLLDLPFPRALGYLDSSVLKPSAVGQGLGSQVTWKREGGWDHILKVEFKERMENDGFGLISDWKVEIATCIFHSKWSVVNGPGFYPEHIWDPWDLCGFIMGDATSFRTVS